MADRPAAGSRFESDLRAIRDARGVTLSEVQQQTRIPVDVLERFEAGKLLGDPHFNEVYLKALLRSYGEAVGLAPNEVMDAYAAQKGGSYAGALRRHLGEKPGAAEPPAPPATSPPPPPAASAPPPAPPSVEEPAPVPPPAASSEVRPAGGAAPAVEALRRTPAPAEAPPPRPVREEKTRVRSQHEASSTATPIDRSWGVIIAGTVIGVLVIGALLWFLLRPEDRLEPIERPTAAADTAAAPAATDTLAAAAAQPAATAGPRLQTPIRVTLTAQGGPLQNFRVTSEPDARRPYWIEQGDSQEFTSEQAVVIWGTGGDGSFSIPSAARLTLQGYSWTPTGGPVRIDAQRGQAILDSLHRVQGGAPAGAPAQGGTPAQGATPPPAPPPPAG
jgi:hypothetical protein